MGNKSSNRKNKKKEASKDTKIIKNSKNNNQNDESNDYVDIKSILEKITPYRKKELIDFLLSNVTEIEELQKDKQQQINNENLSFPFVSKFDYYKDPINSYLILVSNDIVIVPTKHIYQNNKSTGSLSFSQLKKDIDNDIFHLIIENDDYINDFSIIKIMNKEFNFKNYYEIPDNSMDISSYEKFYINKKSEEESLGINITNIKEMSDTNKICPISPIYIKQDDKLFLIGIINKNNEFYIFSSYELTNIKQKIENIILNLNYVK